MRRTLTWIGIATTLALFAPRALADEEREQALELEAEPDPAPSPPAEIDVQREPELEADDDAGESNEPEGRWYLGGFYRHTWTPAFLLEPFLQEVASTNNHGGGLEASYSQGKLDISIAGYWQGYSAYGPFLAKKDPATDTEIIDSSLSQAAVSVGFLGTAAFSEKFAFQYGLDLGVGYVLGKLRRTEAYPGSRGDRGHVGGWTPCEGPSDPNPEYCDPTSAADGENGGHFGAVGRKWTQGGSVPNVWFRFAPRIALRYTPTPRLRLRVDGGFDLFSGLFVGGGLAIGL